MIDLVFRPEYKKENKDNISGLKQNLLVAPIDWFQDIAPADSYPNDDSFTGSLADVENTVKITGNHVFRTGKGFLKLYSTFDTSKLTQGENAVRDKTGNPVDIEAFYPGDSPKVAAMLSMLKNCECIVLAKPLDQSPTGYWYQVGEEDLFAQIMNSFATQTPTGDRKGFALKINAYMARMKYYYGTVTLMPTTP